MEKDAATLAGIRETEEQGAIKAYRAMELKKTTKDLNQPARLERINKELKRRSRESGAYSNDQSLLRVDGCIMMDIN